MQLMQRVERRQKVQFLQKMLIARKANYEKND